jgi:CelD/BcsL family acetyltransferase involved in cellulose biosynthesis
MSSRGAGLTVEQLNPLQDPRWKVLVAKHPFSSVFHTAEWLDALWRTYKYAPLALTTSRANEELRDAVVFCRVHSWLTGLRFVSLPFSDHCEPLIQNETALTALLTSLRARATVDRCRYLELRPLLSLNAMHHCLQRSERFFWHSVNLRPGAGEVFRHFHRDCIQRKIRRAERESIEVREGTGPNALRTFYDLVVQTRRRQCLAPQPIAWFRNVVRCLGDSVSIRLAYKDGLAIAGMMILKHRTTVYYKYGGSDHRFHNMGAMPYLFWHAIADAIAGGYQTLDLGRSDTDNLGLTAFKGHLGATRTRLSYLRFPSQASLPYTSARLRKTFVRTASRYLPERWLIQLGRFLYPHFA